MKGIFNIIKITSNYMYWISAVALVCIMFLTVSDVILRPFSSAFPGTYDLTVILGGIVAGFAIPVSTYKRTHVYMGFFIDNLSARWKKIVEAISQCFAILLFLVIGWNLILYGIKIYKSGELSPTIRFVVHPFVIGMGVACLFNCLVILVQIIEHFVKEENV